MLCVEDQRVLISIIYVIKHGLQWKDVPLEYSFYRTLYNRCVRWDHLRIFNNIFVELAKTEPTDEHLMTDSLTSKLNGQRTTESLLKKGTLSAVLGAQKVD